MSRAAARILRRCGGFIPDRAYLKAMYRVTMHRRLSLDRPATFSEKLQWLKINNRNPRLTGMVDKVEAKALVSSLIGPEYIIPTFGVWEKPADIDFETLPDSFVIKTNHSGGNMGVVIVPDKSKADLHKICRQMGRSLRTDLSRETREWPYRDVERRILAEQFIGTNPVDYKFFCFNGVVDSVMVCMDRDSGDTKYYFFDRDWKLKRYNPRGISAPEGFTVPAPDGIDRMFDIAAELSRGLPFVRVDLYNVGGRIYFGELTFYPDAGFDPNILPETDLRFGRLIDLSIVP